MTKLAVHHSCVSAPFPVVALVLLTLLLVSTVSEMIVETVVFSAVVIVKTVSFPESVVFSAVVWFPTEEVEAGGDDILSFPVEV
jgi:hypothetical protein